MCSCQDRLGVCGSITRGVVDGCCAEIDEDDHCINIYSILSTSFISSQNVNVSAYHTYAGLAGSICIQVCDPLQSDYGLLTH